MRHKQRYFYVAATISLVAVIAGCGGSRQITRCSGTCTPAPTEFLYAFALNDISSFSLSTTGVPTSVANQAGPNQSEGIVVDPSSKFLYVSDFVNGAVDAFTINATNGGLTVVAGSPFPAGTAPDDGGIAIDPGSKFLYVTLLNSSAVVGFTINSSNGALTPIAGSPFAAGNTPFQAIVDPSGKFLYVSNLNDSMGGISAYTINSSTGALTAVLGSPFPTQANFPGPNGLAIGGGGKFLYVCMSGTVNANNVVSAFSINSTTGALTQIAGSPFTTGNNPQRCATDPSGKFLFNVNLMDNTVSAFTIDSTSGSLAQVAGSPFPAHMAPKALVVDPTGGFLYVANSSSNDLSVFSINSMSGILTEIGGSPFATAQANLSGVAIAKTH